MSEQQRNGSADAAPEAVTDAGEVIDGAAERVEETPAPRPAKPWLALVALLIALAACIGAYTAWQRTQAVAAAQQAAHTTLESRVGEVAGSVGQAAQQATARAAGLERRIVEQADALARQGEAMRLADVALRKAIGQDRNRWIVAEAEYLLRVANTRLQMARDLPAALAALTSADQRLGELADPSLLPVRAKVADEAAALRAVPKVDIEGMALSLTSLAKRAETLPVQGARFRPDATKTAPSADPLAAARRVEGWKEAVEAAWGEVKGLVEVRRNDVPVKPMLAPQYEYFLYQNLRLQLDASRLALLRGEKPLFSESLRAARDWAGGYFEQEAPATRALVGELERLAEVDIAPPLPDISGSLRALRATPAYRAVAGEGGAQ